MVESYLSNNILFYVTCIIIFGIGPYIPTIVTPILLGMAGLIWLWRRQNSTQPNKNRLADTWTSLYEKLDKNTIQVESLSQLQQQQRRQFDRVQQNYDALALEFEYYKKTHDQTQQVAALQHTEGNLKKTIKDLRQQEQQHHQEIKDCEDILNALRSDKEALKDKLTTLEEDKKELTQQLFGMQQKIEELQQNNNSNEQQVIDLKDTTTQLEKEISTLQNDQDSKKATLEQHSNELTQQLITANSQIDTLRQETESLETRLTAATDQKDEAWKVQTENYEQQINTLTQQLAIVEQDKKETMESLEQKIDALQCDKDIRSEELTKELEAIKNQHASLLEHQKEMMEREKNELQDHLNNEKRKTEHLHLFVRENNKELHRVAADALNYQQQVEEIKAQLEQQQDQCAEMEQQINELNVDVHQKGLEIQDRQETEDQLRKELDHIGQKKGSMVDQIQHLASELQKLQNDKATLVLEIDDLASRKKAAAAEHSSDEGFWQQRIDRHSEGPHRTHFPQLKVSRSSSIPRLSHTNLSLSRSKSSRMVKSSGNTELYQTIRRLEDMVVELQRQLDDSHAQLEDREQRLCDLLATR